MINFTELFEVSDTNSKNIQIEKNTSDIDKPINKLPWVDKYRPAKLDDIIAQDEAVKMLKSVVKTGNLPHLLFYGPPGTGKTTSVLAIAMELFGPIKIKERVIELNASDERGINIVRNKIVTFAKLAIGNDDENYPSPPYKIIILDEADAMTTEAQSALRKTMEDNSSITRFCFICNYINQIIDPITSRCVKFRFKPISEISIATKLSAIAKREHMKITSESVETIAKISNGDMRRSIMLLQYLKYLNKDIDVDDVLQIANLIPRNMLNNIMNTCVNKNNQIVDIVNLTERIRRSGYSMTSILYQMIDMIINTSKLTDDMKAKICFYISNTEKMLNEGANEYLQLLSVFMYIKKIYMC